jgi:hypothetical protein
MLRIILNSEPAYLNLWRQSEEDFSNCTPMYCSGARSFEKEVLSIFGIQDYSFIVTNDKRIVALVPLYSMVSEEGIFSFAYGREYLRAPLLPIDLIQSKFREIMEFIMSNIDRLSKAKQISQYLLMVDSGCGYRDDEVQYLKELGFNDESTISVVNDLSLAIPVLWRNLRKSYKSLINRAAKDFTCSIISSQNYSFSECENYRELHGLASGRATRNIQSFYTIYEMVRLGKAILVLIKERNGTSIAAHLFFVNAKSALYASSAVHREKTKGVGAGHYALWQAILRLKSLGCVSLDMGQLRVSAEQTDKERSIAHFKRGFGGEEVVTFRGRKLF